MRKLVLIAAMVAASAAHARNGGLYFELAPSWGFFLTDEVIVDDADRSGYDGSDHAELATATFVPALKVGVNLFGWAGAEAHLTGHYWDVNGDPGGAGYVGGVFRVTPLEVLSYILPDTVEIPSLVPAGPVKWKNRPFDLGISIGGGYSVLGEDYLYQGGYFQWGFDVKFFITPNLAVGLDFPFRHMFYTPFRYVNYAKHKGLCTDGAKAYGLNADGDKVYVNPAPYPERNGKDVELSSGDSDECDGPAPSALFFAPAVTIAGVFDFGI